MLELEQEWVECQKITGRQTLAKLKGGWAGKKGLTRWAEEEEEEQEEEDTGGKLGRGEVLISRKEVNSHFSGFSSLHVFTCSVVVLLLSSFCTDRVS